MAHRLGARGVFEAYGTLPDGDPAVLPPPPAEGTSVRWIYWTSGTTSDPKGVLHTDRSLIAGGSCLAHALRLSPDDVGSMAFPYAHIAGPDYTVMPRLVNHEVTFQVVRQGRLVAQRPGFVDVGDTVRRAP